MARPTQSSLLYTQAIGRSLRLYPSPEEIERMSNIGQKPAWIKPHAIIVDYVDNSGRFSLVTAPTLFGLSHKYNARGESILKQSKEIERLEEQHPTLDLRSMTNLYDIRQALITSVHQTDILRPLPIPPEIQKISKFSWLKQPNGIYHLSLPSTQGMLSVREDTLGGWQVYRHNKGVRTLIFSAWDLKQAIKRGEQEISPEDVRLLSAKASWRNEPPTDSQCRCHWNVSRTVRSKFRDWSDYFQFALERYHYGDPGFSRGSISNEIDRCRSARSV